MSALVVFRQTDLERALKAGLKQARKAGFEDVRVRIDPAGGLEVIVGKAATDSLPPEEID